MVHGRTPQGPVLPSGLALPGGSPCHSPLPDLEEGHCNSKIPRLYQSNFGASESVTRCKCAWPLQF